MTVYVPVFREPGLTRFLADWARTVENDHEGMMSRVSANHSLLLRSPAGKVYEVTVDDAGALATTLVQDVLP